MLVGLDESYVHQHHQADGTWVPVLGDELGDLPNAIPEARHKDMVLAHHFIFTG